MASFDLPLTQTSRAAANIARPPLVWAAIAGVALGVAHVASPATLWFVLAMAILFAWAGRGLEPRERRWLWSVLVVAVALRLAAVAALFLTTDHQQVVSFFWDGDGLYLKLRSLWMHNIATGIPVPPWSVNQVFSTVYGWTTYLYVLAFLQLLVGPAPYGIHLLNISLFVGALVVLYRLVRASYGGEPALIGLGLLLFMPTVFAWSVSALKESLFVFLAAVALAATVAALRAPSFQGRALALLTLVGTIATIDGVRKGALFIVAAGLALGLATSVVTRRVLLVPVLIGLLGVGSWFVLRDPGIQTQIMSQLKTAAIFHIGNVRTTGHGYKLLDTRFYADYTNRAIATMTGAEGVRFVLRSIASIVLFPLPWQLQSRSEMAFLPQQVLWYVLVVLAVVGVIAGLRRDPLVTCLFAGVACVGAGVISINSGNIGTMVRHRDTLVPFVVWLSALGAVTTASACVAWGHRATGRMLPLDEVLPASDAHPDARVREHAAD